MLNSEQQISTLIALIGKAFGMYVTGLYCLFIKNVKLKINYKY